MNPFLMFFAMLFLHIIDDYVLQGVLARLKQESWWRENAPDELYKDDYVMALYEHGFEWSFMVHLPFFILLLQSSNLFQIFIYVILVCGQAILHAGIDHAKANKHTINLIADQMFHIGQIVFSCVVIAIAIALI